jgi:hypothetical protein
MSVADYYIKGRRLQDFIYSDPYDYTGGPNIKLHFIQPTTQTDSNSLIDASNRNIILYNNLRCLHFIGLNNQDKMFRPLPTGYTCKTYDGQTKDICEFLYPNFIDHLHPNNVGTPYILNNWVPEGTTHFSAVLVGGGGGGGGAGAGHKPISGSARYGGGGGGGASGTAVYLHKIPYNPSINYYANIGAGGAAGSAPSGYMQSGGTGGTGGTTKIWYVNDGITTDLAIANGGPGGTGGGSAQFEAPTGFLGYGGGRIFAEKSPYPVFGYVAGESIPGAGRIITNEKTHIGGVGGSINNPITTIYYNNIGKGGDGGTNDTLGDPNNSSSFDKPGNSGNNGAIRMFFLKEI